MTDICLFTSMSQDISETKIHFQNNYYYISNLFLAFTNLLELKSRNRSSRLTVILLKRCFCL